MAEEPKKKGWKKKSDFHPGGEKGKLHRELGIPEGEKIPADRLASATHSENPEIRRDAIRAKTMEGWDHGGHKPDGDAKKSRKETIYDHPRSRKGYADGGKVNETLSKEQEERNWNEFLAEQARQNAIEGKGANPYPEEAKEAAKDGKAAGGRVTKTVGAPVGRDDGMIPAQRGEFVVRKSAVKKLGERALDEINKGHLPTKPDEGKKSPEKNHKARTEALYDHPSSRRMRAAD